MLWVTVFFHAYAHAAGGLDPEIERVLRATLEKATKVEEDALHAPACAYFDQISSAMIAASPPANACPAAHRNYEHVSAYDQHLRDTCHDFTSWAAENLRGPSSDNDLWGTLVEKQLELEGETRRPPGPLGLDPAYEIDRTVPLNERNNLACSVPNILLMKYHQSARMRAGDLTTFGHLVLRGKRTREQLLRFLDHGDD